MNSAIIEVSKTPIDVDRTKGFFLNRSSKPAQIDIKNSPIKNEFSAPGFSGYIIDRAFKNPEITSTAIMPDRSTKSDLFSKLDFMGVFLIEINLLDKTLIRKNQDV
ncbi:hypothetical protein [Ekhidna sp.]|uniref:hypothetical protein n=1 Tax=Ekhidna sp. TaxID=2608089 RepID=UPI003B5031DD